MIRKFADIVAEAARRKGGSAGLEATLITTPVWPSSAISAIPDDRILAEMSRWIFYAGFSTRVVDAKWPALERAFSHFDLAINASINDHQMDALGQDPDIIRNRRKIRAVRTNAQLLLDFASSGGSAAHFLAQWPDEDYAGLLHLLQLRGSHLTGHAAMRFLRAIGKPAFILTDDVIEALTREKVIECAPRTREDRAAVQAAFNHWTRQSGRNLTEISRILAMSVAGTPNDVR